MNPLNARLSPLHALLCFVFVACGAAEAEDATADSSGAATAVERISIENWKRHPTIVAIDAEVAAIDKTAMDREKSEMLCDGTGEQSREKSVTSEGEIRKLAMDECGEEHCSASRYYYDGSGHLRHAVVRIIAFPPASTSMTEERVYFDQGGRRIWDVSRGGDSADASRDIEKATFSITAKGEDFAIAGDLLASPAKVFDAPPRCD